MARLREGETAPKSITIVNRVCDDARVRIQEGVKDFPLRTLADKILCEQSEWEAGLPGYPERWKPTALPRGDICHEASHLGIRNRGVGHGHAREPQRLRRQWLYASASAPKDSARGGDFQENRTPDNLFQDPILITHGADIASSGKTSTGQIVPLKPTPLAEAWDMGHSHHNFLTAWGNAAMDGFDRDVVFLSAGPTEVCAA